MFFLYNLIFFIYAIVAFPIFLLKGKLGRGSSSRFGRISEEAKEKLSGQNVWWLHAVSVGEMVLAIRFADRLRGRIQGIKILITTTTQAGFEVGQKIKNEDDFLMFFPIDFPFAVKRFVRNVSPSALVLFETELWPNLINELSKRFIPIFLINGRISDRAFPRYRRINFFLGKVLQKIQILSVQDERMRTRFLELGADPKAVVVGGNMKYDWEPSFSQDQLAAPAKRVLKSLNDFIFMCGSTHEGEEEILFRLYPSLKAKFPSLRMVIAPRHLTRLPAIYKTAERFQVSLRSVSEWAENRSAASDKNSILLIDRVGILASLYEAADLVFVGGSLVAAGGHNLVEPAIYAKPILFGAHMHNFSEMAEDFKRARAAVSVQNEQALGDEIEKLIQEPNRLKALGECAQAIARRHQGASERSLNHVLSFLDANERSFVKV